MKLSGATCRNLLTASCKCKEVIIQQLLRCMSFSKSNHQASLSQVVKGTEFPDTSQTASWVLKVRMWPGLEEPVLSCNSHGRSTRTSRRERRWQVTLNYPSTIPHLHPESDHTYFFIKPHTLNELEKRIKLENYEKGSRWNGWDKIVHNKQNGSRKNDPMCMLPRVHNTIVMHSRC